MCGIAGVLDIAGQGRVDAELLERMAGTLIHRGPDDSGFFIRNNIGLGFRRLSIIDLGTGNQPIYNEDHSITVVCNGEIFNFRELRRDLEARGHKFYTNCDVEVLVHLYEDYGVDLVNKLNGQFAFAIYDDRDGSLFLARDHAGIAPLFYSEKDNLFIFASEIKAILQCSSVSREIDLTGLDQIFSFPAAISPFTIFRDVRSLSPGHYIVVRKGKVSIREYWDLVYPLESEITCDKPISYYLERLEELIQRSVQYRLIADVPVGLYLSGGLDSSIISALTQRLHPDDVRHSFSVGFTDEGIDERKYQRIMAEQIRSVHHEVVFGWQDISAGLRDIVYHAESPLKETYDTCLLAISGLAHKNGIKVVLTGEGSDELFAGYIGHKYDLLRNEEEDMPGAEEFIAREAERAIREHLWGDAGLLYERNQYEIQDIKRSIYSRHIASRIDEFDSVRGTLVDKSRLSGRHPVHKRSYLDFKLRLPHHLLSDHGDRVSFANSVEARYPFLDIDLMEFAKTIPPAMLVNEGTEKYILKKYAGKLLPEQIVRRQKFAFVAPGSPFLLRQDIEWINDLLSYDKIKSQGYFNPDAVELLKKRYRSGKFELNPNLENDLLLIVLTFGILVELFQIPDYN
ncbi:MAG: asparagine synthase (glutamine-hydrolyzing) [Nitrospirae bacterium]|nr:asparagine synthase (glutamine-hydrolyzing) [Nitrospirota bacterium]